MNSLNLSFPLLKCLMILSEFTLLVRSRDMFLPKPIVPGKILSFGVLTENYSDLGTYSL